MMLSRREILQRIQKDRLVSGYTDLESQLQPAGFDLTVEKVYAFESQGSIDFDNKDRVLSKVAELKWDAHGWLELPAGAYKLQFAEEVRFPADLAAQTILRSSLMRCGCILHQGFWDPGYHGKGETVLVVANPKGLRLKKGAKVAQMVFYKLEGASDKLYEGVHQHENV